MGLSLSITSIKSKTMQVAKEILRQLGGNRFLAMTGCYNLAASDNLLCMKLRRNASKANHLRITLTSMDDYNMEFISVRGTNIKVVKSFEGVYCDQLQELFTSVTGMYTSL